MKIDTGITLTDADFFSGKALNRTRPKKLNNANGRLSKIRERTK